MLIWSKKCASVLWRETTNENNQFVKTKTWLSQFIQYNLRGGRVTWNYIYSPSACINVWRCKVWKCICWRWTHVSICYLGINSIYKLCELSWELCKFLCHIIYAMGSIYYHHWGINCIYDFTYKYSFIQIIWDRIRVSCEKFSCFCTKWLFCSKF